MRLFSSRRAAGRRAVFSASAAAVIIAAAALPAGAAAKSPIAGSLRFKGAPHAPSNGNLIDNGGQITSASKTYAIFWGSTSGWSSDVPTGIAKLLGGFGGSNYLGIAGQYMRNASISSTYQISKFDPSAPPRKVSPSTLGNEVAHEFGTPDPNGIYFVYTSNFPKGGGYCAWHSFASVGGHNTAVAYMPNTTNVAGCNPGNSYSLAGSEGLRSLANVTAHEFMEAVTDTWPGTGNYAWIDQSGSEIGDKCAWQFSGPVTLSNGSQWQLQEEWSNSDFGCVQGQ